ncbi:MAG: glycosyltransferase family 4 protein [Pseudohongiellaceae bacterium]
MKILHLVAGELTSGAGKGAYCLHQAQKKLGLDSNVVISGTNTFGDPSIRSIKPTFTKKLYFAFLSRLGNLPTTLYRNRQRKIFNTGFSGIDITRVPGYRDATVIHLHWINSLISIRSLRKVRKPLVWTVRDMWPMTGGCHYSMDCERFRTGCGKCPQLGSKRVNDLSRLVIWSKNRALPKSMRVVGISPWVAESASSSKVFQDFDVSTIYNNVDCNLFYPVAKDKARQFLAIPQGKWVILAGAQRVSDFYKGFDLFVEALKYLKDYNQDYHLVLFGKVTEQDLGLIDMDVTNLGFLDDSGLLRQAYSAADVFVAPSRMEAFGKTIAESMACATPVVCFNATGPRDLVLHRQTGYKADAFNTADMAAGIHWVASRPEEEAKQLRLRSRAHAVETFDAEVVAKQYINLYRTILDADEERSSI